MVASGSYRFSLRPASGSLLFVCLAFAWMNPPPCDSFFHLSPPVSRQSSAPQQTANPPLLKHPPIRFALPRRVYTCDGGATLTVLIETNAVRVMLNGQVFNLQAVSDGAKYSDGAIVWLTDDKGEAGVLEDHSNAANTKTLAKNCRLQSTFPSRAMPLSTLAGTVTFAKRPSLPEGAILLVELRDQNGSASGPAAELAEVQIPLKGCSSPVTFELKFDRAQLPTGVRAALLASISSGTKQLFLLKDPFPIPDLANPPPIALALSPVGHGKSHPPSAATPQNPPQQGLERPLADTSQLYLWPSPALRGQSL